MFTFAFSQTSSTHTCVSVSPAPSLDGEGKEGENFMSTATPAASAICDRGQQKLAPPPAEPSVADEQTRPSEKLQQAMPTTSFSRRKGPEMRALEACEVRKIAEAQANQSRGGTGADLQGGVGTDGSQHDPPSMTLVLQELTSAEEIQSEFLRVEGRSAADARTDQEQDANVFEQDNLHEKFQVDEEDIKREFAKLLHSSAPSCIASTPQLIPRGTECDRDQQSDSELKNQPEEAQTTPKMQSKYLTQGNTAASDSAVEFSTEQCVSDADPKSQSQGPFEGAMKLELEIATECEGHQTMQDSSKIMIAEPNVTLTGQTEPSIHAAVWKVCSYI